MCVSACFCLKSFSSSLHTFTFKKFSVISLIEPVCRRHDNLQSIIMKSRLTSMCNYGLPITCRDCSGRSRSKVRPVCTKRLSFLCMQRQGQQPLHHSLSVHHPPSRELNSELMFVQYFMCTAFHLLNTQLIKLCLKSYFESQLNLSLNQSFCTVYTSWLNYLSETIPLETIVNTCAHCINYKVCVACIFTWIDFLCVCFSLPAELASSKRQGGYVYTGWQKPSCKYQSVYISLFGPLTLSILF